MTPPAVALYDWIRKGFTFNGRSSRSDFWWTRLFLFSTNLVLIFVFMSAIGPDGLAALEAWAEAVSAGDVAARSTLPIEWDEIAAPGRFVFVFGVVVAILTFVPDIALSWRRFQDMNVPGWLHLIFLMGGAFWLGAGLMELVLFIRRGMRGPNRFGPDPTNRDFS